MLSIQRCREHLGETDLSDKQIEEFRDNLYVLCETIIDDYIEKGLDQ